MLTQEQKDQIIEAVEEELSDFSKYPNIGSSKVMALKIDDLSINIEVVSDEVESDEDDD